MPYILKEYLKNVIRNLHNYMNFSDSSKFGYQPGTTYEYDYDVDTTTLIQGASEGMSGLKMTAKVQVEVLSKCDLVLKVKNVQLHERNPESPQNLILSAMSGEFSQQLEENSLWFSFQDGRIESLCPAESEKSWVLNIKRGILSMIQNTMEDLQADQKVREVSEHGFSQIISVLFYSLFKTLEKKMLIENVYLRRT